MAQLKCCQWELSFVQVDALRPFPCAAGQERSAMLRSGIRRVSITKVSLGWIYSEGVKRSVSAREVLTLGANRMMFVVFRKENHMRARICMLWIAVIMPSALASAQHLEIGGFASYGNFDVPRFPDTAVGVGGRLDINITPWLALEGEGSYDFKHPGFEIVSNGATVDVTTLRLGIVHGNGGLKFQLKGGSYFFFLKGGVLDFLP